MKRYIFAALLLLSACTATAPSNVISDSVPLLEQLAALPGARVDVEEPLRFSYPEQTMFAAAAVLPLPGGLAMLDPLAAFLRRNPGLNWRVDVRVTTAHGSDYDQNLAEKRSELLATYLLSREVALADLNFHPEAGSGQPLEFTLTEPRPAASK